jgi:hypothetical protein
MSSVTVSLPFKKDREARRKAVAESDVAVMTASKKQKQAFKKMKKQRKRAG